MISYSINYLTVFSRHRFGLGKLGVELTMKGFATLRGVFTDAAERVIPVDCEPMFLERGGEDACAIRTICYGIMKNIVSALILSH